MNPLGLLGDFGGWVLACGRSIPEKSTIASFTVQASTWYSFSSVGSDGAFFDPAETNVQPSKIAFLATLITESLQMADCLLTWWNELPAPLHTEDRLCSIVTASEMGHDSVAADESV